MTMLTEDDLWMFNEGVHTRLHDRLGAHPGVGPGGDEGLPLRRLGTQRPSGVRGR